MPEFDVDALEQELREVLLKHGISPRVVKVASESDDDISVRSRFIEIFMRGRR